MSVAGQDHSAAFRLELVLLVGRLVVVAVLLNASSVSLRSHRTISAVVTPPIGGAVVTLRLACVHDCMRVCESPASHLSCWPIGFRLNEFNLRWILQNEPVLSAAVLVLSPASSSDQLPATPSWSSSRSRSQRGAGPPTATPLPSFQLLGNTKIAANQCLFSHSTNIPSPDRVRPRKPCRVLT